MMSEMSQMAHCFFQKKTEFWDLPIAGIMAVATLCLLGVFGSVTATHRIYLERRHLGQGLGKIRSFSSSKRCQAAKT